MDKSPVSTPLQREQLCEAPRVQGPVAGPSRWPHLSLRSMLQEGDWGYLNGKG